MLKIKDNVDLKELEKLGFEKNQFYPNYVYECRTTKSYYYVFISVNKHTKIINGVLGDYKHTQLSDEQIERFCPFIFHLGLVEKVGEDD